MERQTIIAEIKRVAGGADTLTQREFEERSNIGLTTVRYTFGTWNQAIEAAGLLPIPPGSSTPERRQNASDEEYLQEIIRLTRDIGRKVALAEMNAKGCFSVKPYLARWGSFPKA